MKKRALSMLCAGILGVSLVGCSQPATTTTTAAPETTAAASETTTAVGETVAAADASEIKAPEGFPKDPITFVVGFAAGGGVDTATRLMTKYLQEYVDVPIVVTNTTGASGVVAVTDVLKKPADGYTVVTLASGAALGDCTGTATYSYLDDIEFIALQDSVPYALSFRKDDERFSTGDELSLIHI